MTSIQITNIKQFMKYILTGNIFDEFYIFKLEVSSFCSFSIDGSINNEFYTLDEKELINGRKYVRWSEIKPFVFQIIKGNKTPLSFHIILMPSDDVMNGTIEKCFGKLTAEDVNNLFLNIRFENKALNLITGTSRKSFTMDKTLDEAWDDKVKQFLKYNEIS